MQAARGLVEEEQARVGQQLDGNADALSLTAGKLRDALVGVLGQLDLGQGGIDAPTDLGAAHVGGQAQPARVRQRPSHRQRTVYDVFLRDIAAHAAREFEHLASVVTVESDNPGCGLGLARQGPHQRTLARTASAHRRDELPRKDRQRNVPQDRPAAAHALDEVRGVDAHHACRVPTGASCRPAAGTVRYGTPRRPAAERRARAVLPRTCHSSSPVAHNQASRGWFDDGMTSGEYRAVEHDIGSLAAKNGAGPVEEYPRCWRTCKPLLNRGAAAGSRLDLGLSGTPAPERRRIHHCPAPGPCAGR